MKRPFSNQPQQLTTFIGREQALNEIVQRLSDPACRLLTLVGPGGIGKTRLAAEVTAVYQQTTATETAIVYLQAANSAETLMTTIADALHFPLSGQDSLQSQLFAHLAKRTLLLVLDNFEQLLDDAYLLTELLNTAVSVKLLVTSRETLNLAEEWLYPVHGLSLPENSANDWNTIKTTSSVTLFVERAQRMRPDFAPETTAAPIAHICTLVGGMPLGIELAASWTKSLTCADIAAEIEQNISFLSTNLRNVPERHRTIRAVFDQSWQHLSEAERQVFARLSIFRGGFFREAAATITGANLSLLSSLVDKSLLVWGGNGRYHIHELLRQYAAEKLCENSDDHDRITNLHSNYFADFLNQALPGLMGDQQIETFQAISAELDNIRAAWNYAIANKNVANIGKSASALSNFFEYGSRYLEAMQFLNQGIEMASAVSPTPANERALAILLVVRTWIHLRFGDVDAAETDAQASQSICDRLDIESLPGIAADPSLPLGVVALIRGRYDEAMQLGEHARNASIAQENAHARQYACYNLAEATLAQGKLDLAQKYAQEAYDMTLSTGDQWFRAYCLLELGHVTTALKDYTAAKMHYQASHDLRQAFDDAEGMAIALCALGSVAFKQQQFEDAHDFYTRSLSLYQNNINDTGGLARALHGLGKTAVSLPNFPDAFNHLHHSLELAASINYTPLLHNLLLTIGDLLQQTEQAEQSAVLWQLVTTHPDARQEAQTAAQERLSGVAVDEMLETPSIDEIIPSLLTLLKSKPTVSEVKPTNQPTNSKLVEPLTPRELEVLQHIAVGSTNRQIADLLFLSPGTVKYYTSQIYSKLNVSSRTQAVAQARELGLIA